MTTSIYDIITDKILAKLEEGTAPWHKSWRTQTPMNFFTGKAYRGINTFLLAGYEDPRFMTFNQIKSKKGWLKKGAKSEIVVFWTKLENKKSNEDEVDADDEDLINSRKFVLKYFNVFNAKDIEGIEFPKLESNTNNTIQTAQEIADSYLQQIKSFSHGGDRAYYAPNNDHIQMPTLNSFDSSEEYYSALFHEIAHSTGHASRLDRKGITELSRFGSHSYSYEELIAEMTSAFICNAAGIENTIDNSAAYIQGWSKVLKENKKMIVQAAGQAQKAADFILNNESVKEDVAA